MKIKKVGIWAVWCNNNFCKKNNLSWSQSLNRKVKQTTPLIHKTEVTYGKHLSVKLVYNRSWFNSRDWRTSLSLRCICTIQCIKTRRSESFQSCAFTQINFSPSCLNLEKISWYQMFQILSIPREAQPHGFLVSFFFFLFLPWDLVYSAGICQSPTRRALSILFLCWITLGWIQ